MAKRKTARSKPKKKVVQHAQPQKHVVQHAQPSHVQHHAKHGKNKGLAIVALLVNALVMPGLGSIIGGRTKTGIWQLVLSIGGGIGIFVGVLLTVTVIGAILGIPLIVLGSIAGLVGWIWGIVTGIQLLGE